MPGGRGRHGSRRRPCGVCHAEKRWKSKRDGNRQKQRSDASYHEQLRDLGHKVPWQPGGSTAGGADG